MDTAKSIGILNTSTHSSILLISPWSFFLSTVSFLRSLAAGALRQTKLSTFESTLKPLIFKSAMDQIAMTQDAEVEWEDILQGDGDEENETLSLKENDEFLLTSSFTRFVSFRLMVNSI